MKMGLFLLVFSFLFSCSPNSEKDNGESYPPGDYSQVGVASWYGPGFHNKKTASGELFDMYACTAAHRSLPLGTSVRVTNLENGREVIVKINDRGPYAGGRIVDLSHAAAGSVGITEENGIAKVRIRVLSSFLSDYFRTKPVLLTLLAAVLGTSGMGLFILSVKRLGFVSTDVVRAVGEMYTEPSRNTLLPGVIIHFVVGVVVAFLYIAFLGPFFSCSISSSVGMGAGTGLIAGFAVSSFLIIFLKRHNPLEEFHEVGFEVGAVYLIGCFIYGIILGATTGIMYVKFL